jgi:hypothetical protein
MNQSPVDRQNGWKLFGHQKYQLFPLMRPNEGRIVAKLLGDP